MTASLSNVAQGSLVVLAPFFLSFVFTIYTCWVLRIHYHSYCMLRMVHFHSAVYTEDDDAPCMHVVGPWSHPGQASSRAVRKLLLSLVWPPAMHRDDIEFVGRIMEAGARREAAHEQRKQATQAQQEGGERQEDGGQRENGAQAQHDGSPSARLLRVATFGQRLRSLRKDSVGAAELPAAVAPWWLPPEEQPGEVSAVLSTTSVLLGKADVARRDRVLGTSASGRRAWVATRRYAVLFQEAGPGPTSEVVNLVRQVEASEADGAPPLLVVEQPIADACKPAKPGSTKAGAWQATKVWIQRHLLGEEPLTTEIGLEAKAHLEAVLREQYPSFQQLLSVHDHRRVDALIGEWDHKVAARLEQCRALLAKMEEGPLLSGSDDGELEGGRGSCCAQRPHTMAQAAEREKLEAELAELEEKAAEIEARILEERAATLALPLPTAFIALFGSQAEALMAAGSAHGQYGRQRTYYLTSQLASSPSDVNWPALWTSWRGAWWRHLLAIIPLALIMLFPIGLITGAMTNLEVALCSHPETNDLYWPWFCEDTSTGHNMFEKIVTALLPSAISTFWDTYALPIFFYLLAQMERAHPSLSSLDHKVTTLFFVFGIVNFFLQSVVGGALFQQAGQITNSLGNWVELVGVSLPSAANFFVNYIMIHALFTNVFRFVWPHDGTVLFVLFRALSLFRPKSARDEYIIRTPPSYRTGRHIGSFFNVFIVAFAYSVVSPIILPISLLYFFTNWVAWRYAILDFYERSYESGGSSWENLYILMLWAQYVGCFFAAVVLMAKEQLALGIVLLVVQGVIHYHAYSGVQQHAARYVRHPPLHLARHTPMAEIDPAVYLPPPLRHGAVGWYPEWGKVWEKYGIPRYTL